MINHEFKYGDLIVFLFPEKSILFENFVKRTKKMNLSML